jgi:hypothetical protein
VLRATKALDIAEQFSAVSKKAMAENVKLVEELTKACAGWAEALNAIKRVEAVLSRNGCDCECAHLWDEHDIDCERCLACRVEAALRDEVL